MRRARWFLAAYVAAVCEVLIALQGGDPIMERAGAVIPFAVLVVAMATGRRPAG